MYLDGYVIAGIVIVVLTCAVVGYVGWFGYRHIKQDVDKAESEEKF